ncbi:MAG: hypothetical protein WEB64_10705 [Marinobacter sp.]|uniref:hypothetical protein n=1 Tax=Marinobacter sp. TaxID=50741 RepID=UPI0034A0237B
MQSFKKLSKFSGLVITLVALSACSEGPSASDAQKAVETRLNELNSSQGTDRLKIDDVKVINCASGESLPSYTCDIEYSVTPNYGPYEGQTEMNAQQFKLAESSNGWIVMN